MKDSSDLNPYKFRPYPILPDCIITDCKDKSSDLEPVNNNLAVLVDIKAGQALLRGADLYAPGVLAATKSIKQNIKVSVWTCLDSSPPIRGTVIPVSYTHLTLPTTPYV
eukprot:TRINITY_DN22359_c0_g1_i1.p1 TRINITY_DN22359_c0_g1~~TRINITY_DN22359_c0_g1_i1.p1  ORF type:complete len:109 (-),score=8.66 TRINITY_DN22359_c0_g1_i1:4-330(-)